MRHDRVGGWAVVFLASFTARRLAVNSWNRADVRRELHLRGRLPVGPWRRSWLHATVRASDWPEWARAAAKSSIPVEREPEPDQILLRACAVPLDGPALYSARAIARSRR